MSAVLRNGSHYEQPFICIQSRATRHMPNTFKKNIEVLPCLYPLLCSAGAHLGLMQFVHSCTRMPVASVHYLCLAHHASTLADFFLRDRGLSLLLSFHIFTHFRIPFFHSSIITTFSHTLFNLAHGMFTIVRYHLHAFRHATILHHFLSDQRKRKKCRHLKSSIWPT